MSVSDLTSGDVVYIENGDILRRGFYHIDDHAGKLAVVLGDVTRPSGGGYVYVLVDGQFLELWTGRSLNRLVKAQCAVYLPAM